MTRVPLVLLPGMLSDEGCFAHQMAHLADVADISVVVLDQQSRREMADHVLACAPDHFAVAGISMGGWVAQEVAARAPGRVQKATLLNTWASPIPADMAALFAQHMTLARSGGFDQIAEMAAARAFRPSSLDDHSLVGAHRAMVDRLGVEVYLRQMQAMSDPTDWRPALAGIRCPTLVVHARQDAIYSLEEHREITRRIPDARLAIVEDCGHASTMEQPQAVTALLRLWLEYP